MGKKAKKKDQRRLDLVRDDVAREHFEQVQRDAMKALRSRFDQLEATAAARLDRIVEATTQQASQRGDSLLVGLTSTADQANAAIISVVDHVDVTAADATARLSTAIQAADAQVDIVRQRGADAEAQYNAALSALATMERSHHDTFATAQRAIDDQLEWLAGC